MRKYTLLILGSLACAGTAKPFVMELRNLQTITTPLFSVTPDAGGGMSITRGEQSYEVESFFSYPHMPAGGWNNLGSSPPPVDYYSSVVATETVTNTGQRYNTALSVAMVQGWVDNPADNAGVLFTLDAPQGEYIRIYTSEWSGISHRPALTIDYTVMQNGEQIVFQDGFTNALSGGVAYAGTEDIGIRSAAPGAAYNGTSQIVGFAGTSTDKMLLRFDLTSLTSGLTEGESVRINAATLSYSKINEATLTAARTLSIHQIAPANAGWIEGTSTWNAMVPSVSNWAGSAGLSTAESDSMWEVSLRISSKNFIIHARGEWYTLQRKVTVRDDHLLIQDTFANTSSEDIAIAFDNKVTSRQMPQEINVGGKYVTSRYPYNARFPSKNPTLFIHAAGGGGLGMVAIDDYYRSQYALKQDGQSAWYENRNFGLEPGGSYTFEWALYLTAEKDYYEFINLVRRDHVTPVTIEGGHAWLSYHSATNWSTGKLTNWLRTRNAKIVVLVGPKSGAPWLGGYGQHLYDVPGEYDETAHLNSLKLAGDRLRSIDPGIKILAPFETALTPDVPAGVLEPLFSDSTVYMPCGAAAGWKFPVNPEDRDEFELTEPHAYVYYPTLTNSYYAHMRGIIERALDKADLDGIYFDIFEYTGSSLYPWTYDQWDGRSVDIDLNTFTIARKKAEVSKLSEDARAELVQFILDHKKGNVVVVNHPPVPSKLRKLPIFAFTETLADYGYATTHFSTPIQFGWTKGYNEAAESIGKEGEWWQMWESDADYFQDVRDKLASGTLYYTYWAPPGTMGGDNLTRLGILSRMFPITVEEIHAGCIKGKERIITLHSGTYSWGDDRPAVAYIYDAGGVESPGEIETRLRSDGSLEFTIEVPEYGAAVIERLPEGAAWIIFQDGVTNALSGGAVYAGTDDIGIRSAGWTNSYNDATAQLVGRAGTSNDRMLLRFDLTSLTSGLAPGERIQINYAVLSYSKMLTPEGTQLAADRTLSIYQIAEANADWIEGVSTWGQKQPGVANWAGVAGLRWADTDYYSGAVASATVGNAAQRFNAALPVAMVQGWVDEPDDNAGVLFTLMDAEQGEAVRIYTSEYATGSPPVPSIHRPALTLVYTVIPEP